VAYFDCWTDPVVDDLLADRADIEPVRLELDGDVDLNWRRLTGSHGYQCLIRTEAAKRPGSGERWLANADLVDRCPNLLAVCSAGAGYDVIDVDACTAAGVIVCHNSGPGAEAVAEHALGFMLTLAKRIGLADRMVRRGPVDDRSALRGTELRGKTLGIVGLGRIGSRLAQLCEPFAMTVLAYDPYRSPADVGDDGARAVGLDELLTRADFLCVTCPLTTETAGMLGAAQFARMKPTAFFVTTARGGIHDERALVEALETGAIAGAAVDVFDVEPPRSDHPLLALDNVVVSPHTAGITVEAAHDIGVETARQWLAIFDGEIPPRLVNPAAWERYADRFEERLGTRPMELA
jgi:D-3-phosphoglycerate dehydrogenase